MIKLMLNIIFLNLLIITTTYSFNDENPYNKEGEKIKILDKSIKYDSRFYIFTNINSCNVYKQNISTVYNIFSEFKIEFVVFLNYLDQRSADIIKNRNKWNFNVIGDEYGIYTDHYNVKSDPFIIITDNSGFVLVKSKLTGKDFNIKETRELIIKNIDTSESTNLSKNLKEIKRIHVLNDSLNLISGDFRSIIYDSKNNQFILRNLRGCQLDFIDSNGVVFKTVNKETNPEMECLMPYDGLSWSSNDKSLYLYDMKKNGIPFFQIYDVIDNTISQPKEIILNKNGKRDRQSYENIFITDLGKIILYYNNNGSENYLMQEEDTTLFVYDTSGLFLYSFGAPDEIYRKHQVSDRFREIICIDKSRNVISIQNFSNILKYWDYKGHLIKKQQLSFGKSFRNIDFDIKDTLSREESVGIWNKISRTMNILHNNRNGNNLISYRNLTFPSGVLDMFSDEVKREVFFMIVDEEGNRLTDEDILLPGYCIPFYFYDSFIYATELDYKKNLEIVIYKFEPDKK